MSFSEYRASGGRFDPKTEYERLYQLKLQHGFTVPVMEGYEQYGLKYTDKRGTLNINNPAFNGVKDYRSKFVTSKNVLMASLNGLILVLVKCLMLRQLKIHC